MIQPVPARQGHGCHLPAANFFQLNGRVGGVLHKHTPVCGSRWQRLPAGTHPRVNSRLLAGLLARLPCAAARGCQPQQFAGASAWQSSAGWHWQLHAVAMLAADCTCTSLQCRLACWLCMPLCRCCGGAESRHAWCVCARSTLCLCAGHVRASLLQRFACSLAAPTADLSLFVTVALAAAAACQDGAVVC